MASQMPATPSATVTAKAAKFTIMVTIIVVDPPPSFRKTLHRRYGRFRDAARPLPSLASGRGALRGRNGMT
jgi:hypothetical protein